MKARGIAEDKEWHSTPQDGPLGRKTQESPAAVSCCSVAAKHMRAWSLLFSQVLLFFTARGALWPVGGAAPLSL